MKIRCVTPFVSLFLIGWPTVYAGKPYYFGDPHPQHLHFNGVGILADLRECNQQA